MPPGDVPDCPWCLSAALERVWVERDMTTYVCACCSKQSWVDREGVAHRQAPVRRQVRGLEDP